MATSFSENFDAYYSSLYDLRLYHECKGYVEDNDRYYWQPLYEEDVAEFYQDNDEPELFHDSLIEPEEF